MNDKLEVRRGSGNLFRDHGDPEAETKKLKAQLAAEIIGELNARGWTTAKREKNSASTRPTSSASATPPSTGLRLIGWCGC